MFALSWEIALALNFFMPLNFALILGFWTTFNLGAYNNFSPADCHYFPISSKNIFDSENISKKS